jgi:cytidyltransferase-like protein
MSNYSKRRVVVFGIFDGVHDGHRDLFRQALRQAQGKLAELIVIVGRDDIAEKLKGKKPKYSQQERIEMLKKEPLVSDAMLGDEELSTYNVLLQCNPDSICVGYDQNELEVDLRRWLDAHGKNLEFHRAQPYKESTFHNSLLQY